MIPECDTSRIQTQQKTEKLDAGQLQIQQENSEKYYLYRRVKDLNSRNVKLKKQILYFMEELGEFNDLCKLLKDTKFLQEHNEEQMKQIKTLADNNYVVD